MAEPDRTQKMLLAYEDEFANAFSVLALKNTIHLDPSRLKEANSEYELFTGDKTAEFRRDVVKLYDGFECGIVVMGLENQMKPD